MMINSESCLFVVLNSVITSLVCKYYSTCPVCCCLMTALFQTPTTTILEILTVWHGLVDLYYIIA